MKLKYIMITTLLAGCTVFSPQDTLYKELNNPTPLNEVKLIITKTDFLSAGWICAKRAGYPAFIHPVILTIFGCATVHMKNGKVTSCDIVYCCDFALEHELNHCKGWDD